MRIGFYTLGCKVNQYETEILKELFAAKGYEIVDPEEPVDLFVVNSCTVTASGDKKTRQALRRLKRKNPTAVAVLTGCVPQTCPDIAQQLPEADVITGSNCRGALVEAVEEHLTTGERIVRIVPHTKGEAFEEMKASAMESKTRAFLKIQDGCSRYCAYCIIPTARGPIRSKSLEALKLELTQLAQAGYREVVLAGINLSLYGRDFGARLIDAVALACTTQGIQRVRLGSVEPDLLSDEDIAAMAGYPNLCPQFHLALQSGCDATLARMNRHYTTQEYAQVAQRFRSLFPNAAITTDIIVGFPGETDEEFAQTCSFVKSLGLARAHVFSYSIRKGTAAAAMDGQVDPQVKERRCKELTAITDQTRLAFYQSQVGRTEPVLFEAKQHPDFVVGHTPNYTPVTVPCPDNLRGEIRMVKITAAGPEGCQGEFLSRVSGAECPTLG